MPKGGHLTTAWARLSAHALLLLTLVVMWLVPHVQGTPAEAAASTVSATNSSPIPKPLQAMAERPRTVSALPIAGVAFEQVPLPAVSRPAARPTAKPSTARKSVISPTPARYTAVRAGWGQDISWPQCDGAYPGQHDVGVVGVTGGRPFTTNPCLASEFAWARASQMPGGAQLYLNLELDGTSTGPHHCGADDHSCRAYDYGWASVMDAMSRASGAGVSASFWWLDVEVGNNWSDLHLDWNAQAVQGAIDAARNRGYDVGIYSSWDQWAQILPDTYHPGVPTWRAVVGDEVMAPGMCAASHSLTGGPVYMVQYDDHTFDKDHVCAAGAAAFAAAALRHPR